MIKKIKDWFKKKFGKEDKVVEKKEEKESIENGKKNEDKSGATSQKD